MKKLKLQDLNGAELSQIKITFESSGQVWSKNIEISGTGDVIYSHHIELHRKITKSRFINLLRKIIESGFFELKEQRNCYSLMISDGKLEMFPLGICDGLSEVLTVTVGDRQRCVECYFDNSTALKGVFKEFHKIMNRIENVVSN